MQKQKVIVSIDIGIKNLAVAIISDYIKGFNELSVDIKLFDLTKTKSKFQVSIDRALQLKNIFEIIAEKYAFHKIIIERQVKQNIIASCLMYSIISISLNYVQPEDIILFDPKSKFSKLKISYNTKNKEHKKLSVRLISNFLKNTKNECISSFESFDKKDDVADALFQALVFVAVENEEKNKLRSLLMNDF